MSGEIKSESSDQSHPPAHEREMLTLDDDAPEESFADKIAYNLKEPNKELIRKIVEVIGKEEAVKVFDETIKTEESGGILREDGNRKTPGGVFFYIIQHNNDIYSEQIKRIFAEENQKKYKERRTQSKEKQRMRTEKWRAKIIEGFGNKILICPKCGGERKDDN